MADMSRDGKYLDIQPAKTDTLQEPEDVKLAMQ